MTYHEGHGVDRIPENTRILVVDDDISILSILSNTIARLGIEPSTASSAYKCFEMLAEDTYHLMLLDLMLPDVDGFEILERLRSDARHDNMPVIVLTARTEPEAISKVLALGADGYITKPYLPNTLTQRIISMLGTGRQ